MDFLYSRDSPPLPAGAKGHERQEKVEVPLAPASQTTKKGVRTKLLTQPLIITAACDKAARQLTEIGYIEEEKLVELGGLRCSIVPELSIQRFGSLRIIFLSVCSEN